MPLARANYLDALAATISRVVIRSGEDSPIKLPTPQIAAYLAKGLVESEKGGDLQIYSPIWTSVGVGISPKGTDYEGKPIIGMIGSINIQEFKESVIKSTRGMSKSTRGMSDIQLVEPDLESIVVIDDTRLVEQTEGYIERYEQIGDKPYAQFPVIGTNNRGLGRANPSDYFADKRMQFGPLALRVELFGNSYRFTLTIMPPHINNAVWDIINYERK
jgi:hypothetical protein